MAQTIVRNLNGTAVSFQTSQIMNIRATTDNQLLQAFKSVLPGAVNEMKPIALVQTRLSTEHRQVYILKAFLVSPTYWAAIVEGASPDILKTLNVYSLTSDFLLSGDRFNRVLSRLSPRQERKDKTYEIMSVGEGIEEIGQVDVGFPFVDDTLNVVGAEPTGTEPSLGLISFAVEDIGTPVDVAFVTSPVYNVIRVVRTHDQVADSNGVVHPPYAYVMHPALADPLSIELPVV